jgi:hypothetical protein
VWTALQLSNSVFLYLYWIVAKETFGVTLAVHQNFEGKQAENNGSKKKQKRFIIKDFSKFLQLSAIYDNKMVKIVLP